MIYLSIQHFLEHVKTFLFLILHTRWNDQWPHIWLKTTAGKVRRTKDSNKQQTLSMKEMEVLHILTDTRWFQRCVSVPRDQHVKMHQKHLNIFAQEQGYDM